MSDTQILAYTDQYYEELVKTWKFYGWPFCPKELLPEIGFVAVKEGRFLGYMGMYILDDNKGGFLEWTTKGLNSRHLERYWAFKALWEMIKLVAKQRGMKMIYTFTKAPEAIGLYQALGLQTAEENATSFVYYFGKDASFLSD